MKGTYMENHGNTYTLTENPLGDITTISESKTGKTLLFLLLSSSHNNNNITIPPIDHWQMNHKKTFKLKLVKCWRSSIRRYF